ncbi:hypothetical protein PR017_22055 (plasmid) [Rhizobium tumorigenes]|uniref:Uncharacterized protein n=1 Tax=Rhizobium tumorigenes TaxID=2041385 RepID=A0AAF1K9Z0_9HYPH|nr:MULTISPECIES: hypothetical protein [Rhizobium]WFR98399.1 hypothetical protein PR017_22055 [Rhizobium tumorigenes]
MVSTPTGAALVMHGAGQLHESASGRAVVGVLASEKPAIDLDRGIDAVAVAATIGDPCPYFIPSHHAHAEDAVWLDPKEATI